MASWTRQLEFPFVEDEIYGEAYGWTRVHGAWVKNVSHGLSVDDIVVVQPMTPLAEVEVEAYDFGTWKNRLQVGDQVGFVGEGSSFVARTNDYIVFHDPDAKSVSTVSMFVPFHGVVVGIRTSLCKNGQRTIVRVRLCS